MGSVHLGKEIRRVQILEAASYCFTRKDYHSTKLEDIAARAKMSKGSIYRFFPSKHQLYMELFHYTTAKFEDAVRRVEDAGNTPKEVIDKTIEIFLAHLLAEEKAFLADMKFWGLASVDMDMRRHIKKLYDRWTLRLESLFRRGIQAKQFIDINPVIPTTVFISLVDGFIFRAAGSGVAEIRNYAKMAFQEFKRHYYAEGEKAKKKVRGAKGTRERELSGENIKKPPSRSRFRE